MNISFRLKKIADKVDKNSIVLDVGTDHAYIPIFLCLNNIITKAIAVDISQNCIKRATFNIQNFNLSSKIEARVSNGLKSICFSDCIDTCIISGMGGALIIDILKNYIDLTKTFKKLILQPQRDIDKVRMFIHKINFKIVEDEMIEDENRIYTIIVAILGKEEEYSSEEYAFGKFEIKRKSPILKKFIKNECIRIEKLIERLKNLNCDDKVSELTNTYQKYKGIEKCL